MIIATGIICAYWFTIMLSYLWKARWHDQARVFLLNVRQTLMWPFLHDDGIKFTPHDARVVGEMVSIVSGVLDLHEGIGTKPQDFFSVDRLAQMDLLSRELDLVRQEAHNPLVKHAGDVANLSILVAKMSHSPGLLPGPLYFCAGLLSLFGNKESRNSPATIEKESALLQQQMRFVS